MTTINQALINALREILGLGPLYPELEVRQPIRELHLSREEATIMLLREDSTRLHVPIAAPWSKGPW